MIEYIVISFQNFSLSMGAASPQLMLYFMLAGLVVAVIGYWLYKWIGLIISLLGSLLLFLYFTGFFGRIMG